VLQLNLPPYDYKLKEVSGKLQIFDKIRKKYVVLTPEEWVRQHVIHLLNIHLNYPASLIRVEGGLLFNRRQKRTDLVIYSKELTPLVLVECKAPDVAIDQKVLDQATMYNAQCRAPLVILSNGMQTCAIFCQDATNSQILEQIPHYEDLIEML
jgi:hypothetical protein